MSPLKKNTDGIRRSASSGPVRLSPQSDASERVQDAPRGLGESEMELHWEKEGTPEKLYEMRTPLPEKEEYIEAPIIHKPFPARRSRSWGINDRRSFMGAYAGGIAIVAIFVLVSTVFARLTVTIKPRVEEAAIVRVGALFDTSVSKVLTEQKVIPAETFHFSRIVTRDFSATGRARVEERARGTATVYNAFNTSPQILVAGTRFVTDTGSIYRIQRGITVPAAKIAQGKIVPQGIEAHLVADIAGEGANTSGSVRLNVPGFQGTPRYEGFYAIVESGFAGGFQGEAVVVTAGDVKRAQEEVSKTAFSELEAEMGRKTPAGLLALKELREIEMVTIEAPKAGSRAVGPFSASAEAKGTALAFREADVAGLLVSLTLAEHRDREFISGSARLSYTIRTVDFEKGKAEVMIGGDLKIKHTIPEKELASLIAGKKEGTAAELFKTRQEVASFRLSFFPPWRATAPADPAKIRFRVENP
ncbi:MAG: hypothetical protein A3B34_02730 [Candidatus Sungbacteria bacterium RIFCSPLOWO2_01_FULL_54_21]|uniref:Baseplate protein J-like domain-containing protein n=1 Tax=Candidatus Sungbacteria bacterium RIFCSPLOWO2_01_FULL_54_21 TaxID=1802279 RepID=A0A1G2LAV3_9BACT|nr:MAG: hypothetical protein A3B34_02730 [Candidatus Sungbacteria bacterium RIFCSPLOWO2_01_FULL_54_21]